MTSDERPQVPALSTYVYGVTHPEAMAPKADGIGSHGSGVRVVTWETVAAIISHVRPDEVAASARALRTHGRVLDAAIEEGPVVPLRFGTIVDDELAVVNQVLLPHREHLQGLLARLRHRVELAVKASYHEDVIVPQVIAADPMIAALHQRIARVDPDAAYYERIQLGERVAAALEGRRDRDADELYETLADVADDISAGEPLHSHMVINGAFLVRRTNVTAFDQRIDAVARAHPEMQIRYVGPLPPYSFSDIELEG